MSNSSLSSGGDQDEEDKKRNKKKKKKKMEKMESTVVATVDCWNVLDNALDFSFLKLTSPREIKSDQQPRDVLGVIPGRDDHGLYITKSLRLNNNLLDTLTGFTDMLSRIVATQLHWLDLSFNKLTTIDPALTQLPCLQILYLHGNSIADIKDVDQLGRVRSLIKLSLHGNPIDQTTSAYRVYVLVKVRQLEYLDFTRVTPADRTMAVMYTRFNPVRAKKKKKTD